MTVPRFFRERLISYKALTLTGLALPLAALFCAAPAQAQWAVTDNNGKSLIPNNDGSYTLVGQETASVSPNYSPPYFTDSQGVRHYFFSPIDGGASLNTPAGQTTFSVGVQISALNGASGSDSKGLPINETGSIQGSAGGNLWAIFKWTGDPAKAPDHLDLLLSTSASASASGDTGGDTSVLSDLSANATASIDQFGETATATFPAGQAPTSVGGKHLLRVQVQGGVAKVSLSGTVKASASNGVPYFRNAPFGPVITLATVGSGGSFGGSVRMDSREVAISSGIETSYYKGPPDPKTGLPPANQRNADGSMTVDSVVNWNYISTTGWVGSNQFTANDPGFTNPTYAWSASGGTVLVPPSHIGYSEQSIPISIKVSGDVSGLPSQSTVKVTVTDGPGTDGVSASNTYTVRWHLPYEANTHINTIYSKKKGELRCGPVSPGETLLVQQSSAQDIDMSAVFDTGAAISGLAGQEGAAGLLEIAGKLAGITDWKYHYGSEASYTGAANTPGSGNWGLAAGDMNEVYKGANNIDPPSLAGDPNNYSLCYLYIYTVEKDRDDSWYADGYNTNGYDGNPHHIIATHKVDKVESQPFFKQYKNSNGTPYTGS